MKKVIEYKSGLETYEIFHKKVSFDVKGWKDISKTDQTPKYFIV